MVEPSAIDAPLADSGLRCPTCDYNLTGITESDGEHRCPECGHVFKFQDLRRNPGAIPCWEDPGRGAAIRFLRTCWMTWMKPAEFGHQFPTVYRTQAARSFRWTVLVIIIAFGAAIIAPALLPASGSGTPTSTRTPLGAFCAVVTGLPAGVLACEALIALTLSAVLPRPRLARENLRRGLSASWAGLVGYYRGFSIISIAGGLLATVLASGGRSSSGPIWIAAVVVCWWWFSLDTAVAAHCGLGSRRTLATFAIPMIALASILWGSLIAFSLLALLQF